MFNGYSKEYINNVLGITNLEKDEICKSLKMFAVFSTYKPGEVPSPTNGTHTQPIDVIMEEFATNGYSCDDCCLQARSDAGSFNELNIRTQVRKLPATYGGECKKPKRFAAKIEKYAYQPYCVFCDNNNEPEAVVKSHAVRDSLGRVLCPKLRTYVCPICKASGDLAHTVKYCPQKPIITMEDAIKAESFRLARATYFKQGMKI